MRPVIGLLGRAAAFRETGFIFCRASHLLVVYGSFFGGVKVVFSGPVIGLLGWPVLLAFCGRASYLLSLAAFIL